MLGKLQTTNYNLQSFMKKVTDRFKSLRMMRNMAKDDIPRAILHY